MENSRNSKIIAIVALCVGVVGLSLGFAAFSNTLTISSSATVSPDESTFSVAFDGAVTCSTAAAGEYTVTNTGTASGTTLTGLEVAFVKPGTATCTVSVKNLGQYVAYLNSITSENTVSCAVAANADGSTTTKALMDAACATITYSIAVDGDSASATTGNQMNANAIAEHDLAVGASETATITINYAGGEGALADGKFTVSLPTASLVYSSVD